MKIRTVIALKLNKDQHGAVRLLFHALKHKYPSMNQADFLNVFLPAALAHGVNLKLAELGGFGPLEQKKQRPSFPAKGGRQP